MSNYNYLVVRTDKNGEHDPVVVACYVSVDEADKHAALANRAWDDWQNLDDDVNYQDFVTEYDPELDMQEEDWDPSYKVQKVRAVSDVDALVADFRAQAIVSENICAMAVGLSRHQLSYTIIRLKRMMGDAE